MIGKISVATASLLLCGCAGRPPDESYRHVPRAESWAYIHSVDSSINECAKKFRVGMTAAEVKRAVKVQPCKDFFFNGGKLNVVNQVTTAAGTGSQVEWAGGYLYFRDDVLVAIQR